MAPFPWVAQSCEGDPLPPGARFPLVLLLLAAVLCDCVSDATSALPVLRVHSTLNTRVTPCTYRYTVDLPFYTYRSTDNDDESNETDALPLVFQEVRVPPDIQAAMERALEVPWGLQAMQMPTQKEQAALFAQLDFNGAWLAALPGLRGGADRLTLTARVVGNGVLSLAEVDAAVTAIWPTFTHRAAVLRAFRAVDPQSTGLLDPGSFGSLLAYLSAFAGILDEFDQIDTSHDHRLSDSTITKEEVVGACALLKVGVTTAEARQAFDRMEQVRPNHILFDDFAGWIAGRKIGLPSSRARRSPSMRASPGASPRAARKLATDMQTTSPQRPQTSSPSPRGHGASSIRQVRASTPKRPPQARKAMAQATVDRLHNEDRDRRAAREARAQAALKERDEAELAELSMAPKLNQTSLAIAKRVHQTGADSGSRKSFIERDKQWVEARQEKLETHRRVQISEREESVGKGAKMNAKSLAILEKTGRLPNTPIADRLHSAARAQQEKARLKREKEASAEARRKNTVYSAYVPGGKVHPGRAPRAVTPGVDRDPGARLLKQAKEKEEKLEALRKEHQEASVVGLFAPRLNKGGPKPTQPFAERLSRRTAVASSPEEGEPELDPAPERVIDPRMAEEEKRRRRMERRAKQMEQLESAARLQQSAEDARAKQRQKQEQHVEERDRNMGAISEHMANARASVIEARFANKGRQARNSEFLQRRRQYSSPARQRRSRPRSAPRSRSRSRSAHDSSNAMLQLALQHLYEGLTSQHAARDAFHKFDKDSDGRLDTREVKLALRSLSLNLTDIQVDALIDHLDQDGNQEISIDEFLSQIFRGRAQLLRHRFQAASYALGGMDFEALFRQYDRNNNAIMSFEEFERAARRSLKLPKADITEPELRELFDHIDYDRDGGITLDEFKEFLSPVSPGEAQLRLEAVEDAARAGSMPRSAVKFGTPSPRSAANFSSADSTGALTVPDRPSIDEMFLRLDTAGHNQLSLSNVAQGVTELWPDFDDAPALMRAYRAADTTGDGWISAEDFHSLLQYLAFFHRRWPLFNQLDEEYDGKIPIATIKEHCKALGLALPSGSAVAIAELDPQKKGWVAFEEFCSFAARLQGVASSPKHAWLDSGDSPDSEAHRPSKQSPAQLPQTQAREQAMDTSASSAGSPNTFSSPITEEDSDSALAHGSANSPKSDRSAGFDVSPPVSRGPRSPQHGLTVSEAVEAIKTELGLDPSLSIADAVAASWKSLQLENDANLAFKGKVHRLCAELDIQPGWS